MAYKKIRDLLFQYISIHVHGIFFAVAYFLDPYGGIYEGKINVSNDFLQCLYFSFITITTLGYGDILPHGMSKILAITESSVGFLLIAYFINLLSSHSSKQQENEKWQDIRLYLVRKLINTINSVYDNIHQTIRTDICDPIGRDGYDFLTVPYILREERNISSFSGRLQTNWERKKLLISHFDGDSSSLSLNAMRKEVAIYSGALDEDYLPHILRSLNSLESVIDLAKNVVAGYNPRSHYCYEGRPDYSAITTVENELNMLSEKMGAACNLKPMIASIDLISEFNHTISHGKLIYAERKHLVPDKSKL